MPHPRFFKLPVERQREIITAAGKALGRAGCEGTSLNRILEDAGLSKGAAYYYFDGKDDLVATVFVELWQRIMEAMPFDPSLLRADDFWESLGSLAHRFLDSAREEPWTLAAVKAMWAIPPGARSTGPLASAFNTMVAWYAAILRRGRDLGVVRSDLPEELLLAVVWAMDEAADRWIVEHWDELDEAMLSEHYTAMFDMFRRVLAPTNRQADDRTSV